MKKRPMQVALHVRESSVIEFTVGERVQLDRLVPSPRGFIAERHGSLLAPGASTVALAPGHYGFKTLTDAHLRAVHGGFDAHVGGHDKEPPPPPPPGDVSPPLPIAMSTRGDEPAGESPTLTIE